MHKKILLDLVMILFLFNGTGFGEGEENLLPNPGFEQSTAHWGSSGDRTYWAEDEVHSGKYSAKIMVSNLSTASTSKTPAFVSKLIPISGKIKVSVWVKTTDVIKGERESDKARVKFEVCDKDKKSVLHPRGGNLHIDICMVDGTTEWTEYFWEGELPSEANYIQIICGLYRATGTVWFDDLKVISLASSILQEE